jgi:rRNA maturation endonuclease Nob1
MMAATQLVTPPESMTAAAGVPHPPHVHGAGCRYCGGELPDGREALFCPHCGQNLSIKQCPACSTELETEWQFCITCGRQVE